ncbi:uncharacterized protein LOC114938320 [Nylanderia fulva]|uniref:uncharacterized protein LOC114938320 n=1 Tax=Nylanderia fulva TaxID=613905 RepID=UPI0010FB32A9|nr:uncharacterized protein LOC114938320 [Nylanderia fulva]
MHIFRLMRIFKRILCYWLLIFVVLLVVFILSISVVLGASNETNTIFNLENDNQISNKSNDDIEDTSKKDESYDSNNKVPVVAIIIISLLIVILLILSWKYILYPLFYGRRSRVIDVSPRVRNVQPPVVHFLNEEVVIAANDLQVQLPPVEN